MTTEIMIKKASGESVPFSKEKLQKSLERSGASADQIDEILLDVKDKIYSGVPTKQIYKWAFAQLKEGSRWNAAKYHLKHAIMELGPTGYPFERYVGEIMREQGYEIKVGSIEQGRCVQHEIDVIAQIGNKQFMIECKHHNLSGIMCDVKIPLYIRSRFEDVESTWLKSDSQKSYQGCVVTNTRFSLDAIQYGICAGLKLIGWDYPSKDSLKEQIDKLELFPITCLTSLTKREKLWLLDRKIVLCKTINGDEKLLEKCGVKSQRLDTVLQETRQLCKNLRKETPIKKTK